MTGTRIMGKSVLRIGIAGCGTAARIHLDRLLALDDVAIVGCADPELSAAQALADRASQHDKSDNGSMPVPAFADHRELLHRLDLHALAIFSPHLAHYRLAMDALQAGCHLFIEKPLCTDVQEAADIVSLARGRGLKVAVGHQFRLAPSVVEARRRLAAGMIGQVRLITAVLARPWITTLGQDDSTWRFNPKVSSGGVLADAGDHLVDTLLWTTGQGAREVGAFQNEWDPGIDLVTAAVIRFADGTPVTLAVSGISPGTLFEIVYFGEFGRLRVTDQTLEEERFDQHWQDIPLPSPSQSIDENFVAALDDRSTLCCSAEQALDTVRLLEAITRSAATQQVVQVI